MVGLAGLRCIAELHMLIMETDRKIIRTWPTSSEHTGDTGSLNDLLEAGVRSGVVILCDERSKFVSAASIGMDERRTTSEFGLDVGKSAPGSRGGCMDLMGLIFTGVVTDLAPVTVTVEDVDEGRSSRLKVIRDFACFERRPAKEFMDRD